MIFEIPDRESLEVESLRNLLLKYGKPNMDEHPEYPTVKFVNPTLVEFSRLTHEQKLNVIIAFNLQAAWFKGHSVSQAEEDAYEKMPGKLRDLATTLIEDGVTVQALKEHLVSVPNTKPTNPKDIAAISKVPFTRVPYPVLAEAAVALHEGALKYGGYNWREAGVQASVYIDAVGRHLGAWFEGEDIDPESGLSHITKAIAGLMVLRDGMIADNWVDDRPQGCDGFIKALNEKMAELNARYPEPKQPFIGLGKERRTYHG